MHVETFHHCSDTTEVRGIGLTEIGNYQAVLSKYSTEITILQPIYFAAQYKNSLRVQESKQTILLCIDIGIKAS